MAMSGRAMLAVLCLSLAVCVLGRPQLQPSSASPQYSTVQALGNGSLQGSTRKSGTPDLGSLEFPWRRSLKLRAGGRRSGGLGALSTTETIIIFASIAVFVLLLVALACWWSSKKSKNPNWRPTDCFKRNKVPREKMFTSGRSDVDPDADAEHKVAMAMEGPRLDHAKSRKQVSPI